MKTAEWFCEKHPQVFLVRTYYEGESKLGVEYRGTTRLSFCSECHLEKWRRARQQSIEMARQNAHRFSDLIASKMENV